MPSVSVTLYGGPFHGTVETFDSVTQRGSIKKVAPAIEGWSDGDPITSFADATEATYTPRVLYTPDGSTDTFYAHTSWSNEDLIGHLSVPSAPLPDQQSGEVVTDELDSEAFPVLPAD